MSQSTFRLNLKVPKQVHIVSPDREFHLDREDFYAWLWNEYGQLGLLGVHEGTLLSEEANEAGLETESWTIDAGEAPRERDWIASQVLADTEVYFATEKDAKRAQVSLMNISGLKVGRIEEQVAQDWDANWKASFSGVFVPPCWDIVPPWVESSVPPDQLRLRINPGAGFGTGTHETTQLCLGILADAFKRISTQGFTDKNANPPVLDFGSGSGILSIGAALLGGQVDGVEIDPLAIDNALENASLNGIADRIHFGKNLDTNKKYRLVVANILRPVLIEHAAALIQAMTQPGDLILSGLMEPDVEPILREFGGRLKGAKPEIRKLNEWRALWWRVE